MDPALLRISDRDRDEVANALRAAASEGRLTPDEVDDRISRLPGLRTYGDLDGLLADLPVVRPSESLVTTGSVGLQQTAGDVLRLDGGFSSEVRTGQWELPRSIEISGTMGYVRMDCTQASCPHPQVDVNVSGGMGSITIVVPIGWAADIDQLRKSWGSVRSKVANRALPGNPLLVFTGNMGMGSLVVRNPNWFDRYRLSRQLRRQHKAAVAAGWSEGRPAIENPTDLR